MEIKTTAEIKESPNDSKVWVNRDDINKALYNLHYFMDHTKKYIHWEIALSEEFESKLYMDSETIKLN